MCPSETDIIKLTAGELTEEQAQPVRLHISTCQTCQRLLADHEAVWNALAATAAAPPERDLTTLILQAASRPAAAWPSRMRIAAAVLLFIGAGVAVGTAIPVSPPSAVSVATEPDADAAALALGLDAIAVDQTGLTLPVTASPTPAGEEPS